jgi:hypothetical protein
MLARMRTQGVASAEYEKDYAPVRKCTLDGGCLYVYKKIPEEDTNGNYGCKGSLWNYTGYVFGEVDLIYTRVRIICPMDARNPYDICKTGRQESIIRLKLPTGASCASTRLFEDQEDALKQIILKEDGIVVRSILRLRCSALTPTRAARPVDLTLTVESPAWAQWQEHST